MHGLGSIPSMGGETEAISPVREVYTRTDESKPPARRFGDRILTVYHPLVVIWAIDPARLLAPVSMG